nr:MULTISPECIES: MoaD/ThiS family protein [unclassified Roseofilum]
MVKVLIPTPLQKYTKDEATVEVQAATVAELLDALETKCPGIKNRIRKESGEMNRYLNIYVKEEDIRFLQGTETPLNEGDEVSIVPAVAGG